MSEFRGMNPHWTPEKYHKLQKAKDSYERATGRKISWEDFIWMKCMRGV